MMCYYFIILQYVSPVGLFKQSLYSETKRNANYNILCSLITLINALKATILWVYVTFTPFLALMIQSHHCPCTGTAKNFLYNMDS